PKSSMLDGRVGHGGEVPHKEISPDTDAIEVTSPPMEQEPLSPSDEGISRNLENLETHLLSLEWEISRDLIDKIIGELGFLKQAYRDNQPVFHVVDIMGKVARSLADDEGNITPENLRFLLEANKSIRLLSDELKGKEDYKNLVLSGILARHRLMEYLDRQPVKESKDRGDVTDFEAISRDLRELSQQLQKGAHRLGSLIQRLQPPVRSSGSSGVLSTVLMETSGRVFAVEGSDVVRFFRIPYRMARLVWDHREIPIRGTRLPLVNLFRFFGLKGTVEAQDKVLVLVRKRGRTLAILADRLLQRKKVPLQKIRRENDLRYIRGVVHAGEGRNIHLLDTDRMAVELKLTGR
ncbi:MAG: CheW domain-containing protein, partial [Deltaproteobacteria bacterium]|nr:CheW domain-containing protein [Deltaproteobacteria bacterium]